jgi:hypothetical protein
MPSKIVIAHQKLSGELDAALKTHGPAITEAVKAVTRAESVKHAVDVAPLFAHVQREATAALDALVTADNAHQVELGDDQEPRDRRDAVSDELYRALVGLKATTKNLFGDAWVAKLTFPKEASPDPAHVTRAAEQVIEALQTHKLPKPQVPGVGAVDGAAWIAVLQKPLDALAAARGDVKREEEEAHATRTARDAALASLTTANVNAAQLAQVLARIGGMSHLVEGLRGTLDTTTASAADEPTPPTPPTPPA